MKQKGSSQQTAVLFMLLLLVAALAVVAAPRLGQMFGPWVAPGLPENAAVDAAPAAAESFDYEQAADNFAARWVAIGQGYERLGRLNEHHVPPSQSLPTAIVLSMAESLSAGDLDKLMTYWADDATFYIFGLPPNGSELVQGQAALRAEFADEIANHQQLEVEIDTVRGDIIMTREKTWHDFTRQIGVAPLEADRRVPDHGRSDRQLRLDADGSVGGQDSGRAGGDAGRSSATAHRCGAAGLGLHRDLRGRDLPL